MNPQTPTVGRIVHYTLPDYPERKPGVPAANAGEIRAAVIVRVWGETCVNLEVFLDGTNDEGQSRWQTSCLPGTEKGQWQWPPRV